MTRWYVSLWPVLVCSLLSTGLTGCATNATDATQRAPVPSVEDPILARNLAALAERPSPVDLDWRQPKIAVAGVAAATRNAVAGSWAGDAGFAAAAAYSDTMGGLGLIVSRDGSNLATHFADGFDATVPFASYSMHKTVLALAVLAAIEDGVLTGLDAPVGRYIAEWRGDARGDITLAQLLHHESALAHVPLSEGKGRELAYSGRITATALSFPLAGTPGTEFNYNNVNSQIVGIALSRALAERDLDYATYLSQRLWRPLGNREAALWSEAPGGLPRFFAGLEAGLEDWLRVGELIANRGRVGDAQLLSPDSIARLTAPAPSNPAYGLHVWLGDAWTPARRYGPSTPFTVPHAAPYLAAGVVYLDGFGGQRVYVIPEHRLVVARAGAVRFDYDDSIVVNTILRGLVDARARDLMERYRAGDGEAVYRERFDALMRDAGRGGRGLGAYDPVVPLPGADAAAALPRQPAAWIDTRTSDWLDALGASTNTEALLVWHRGRIVWERYFGDGGADSMVISRSLSKPISVLAVGGALARGFIPGLDVPVADYLTEWRGTDKAAITLRHLLQMRSGLAPQAFSPTPEDIMNRAYLHPYHEAVILADYPLVDAPGTRYEYSNANAEILAVILERATGRRYEDWVSESVLEPLGAAGGSIWVNRPDGTTHAGCCALLPAETYLRLALLMIGDGRWQGQRLLPAGFVGDMITPTPFNPHVGMAVYVAGPYIEYRGTANPEVAFGKTLHSEPYLDDQLYLFDGNGNQVVYIVPRHELVVLRVGARPPRETPWDNSLLINRLLRQLSQATGAPLTAQPRS